MGGASKVIDKIVKETFGGAQDTLTAAEKTGGDIIHQKAMQLDPKNIGQTTGDALLADIPMFSRIDQKQASDRGEDKIDILGGYTPPEEEEEEAPNMYLGGLAAGRRTDRGGRGIGANILTSGSGVKTGARTRRKTLLG